MKYRTIASWKTFLTINIINKDQFTRDRKIIFQQRECCFSFNCILDTAQHFWIREMWLLKRNWKFLLHFSMNDQVLFVERPGFWLGPRWHLDIVPDQWGESDKRENVGICWIMPVLIGSSPQPPSHTLPLMRGAIDWHCFYTNCLTIQNSFGLGTFLNWCKVSVSIIICQ